MFSVAQTFLSKFLETLASFTALVHALQPSSHWRRIRGTNDIAESAKFVPRTLPSLKATQCAEPQTEAQA